MNPLLPAWLASAALAPAPASSPGDATEVNAVELPWTRYQTLRALTLDDPDARPPGPWVAQREAELLPVEGGWELHVRWTIEAHAPGWLWQPLMGAGIELRSATWDGTRAPVVALPGGTHLAAFVEASGVLEARAFVPGSLDQPVMLQLMPATRGRLRVTAPGRVPVPMVEGTEAEAPPVLDGGIVWSGARTVGVQLRDPDQAPPVRDMLAVAHAGVGLTVGDAELRGRAHLQWELRHGTLDRVQATVAGLGDDLTVTGDNLASWTRNDDVLQFELSSPASALVDLRLSWTQAVPASDEATVSVPRIEPEAWRSEASLQVARDGELEVIPRVDEWTAIAAAELPGWGQGLVEGTPTAAYRRSAGPGSGALDLLRFVPVPGPPTVVDVATYTMATTAEGRVLMRASYDLRNDRGSHLTVRPPPGLTIIGARVASETALPSRDEQGAWRLPLKRSLETVDGLLSFPVEVIMLGEQEPWSRRERRELALPTLDAPIAASHVTLHLPPRYRSRLDVGEHNVVDQFAEGEGLTYGLGVGDASSAAMADALFQEAVEGYLSNDFEQAQAKLEELEGLGVRNENMSRLQSNIDVIEGKTEADDKGDLAMQRRVKEQARARAAEQFRQQEALIEEAERSASSGDYAQAEAQYQAALELGGELAKLEQSESVEQVAKNEDLQVELETISKKKGKKRGLSKSSGTKNVLDTKFASPQPASSSTPTAGPAPPPDEPQPIVPTDVDADAIPDVAEPEERVYAEEDDAPSLLIEADRSRVLSRRSRRRRGALNTEPVARAKSRRGSRRTRAGAGSRAPGAVTVYDFEDDDIDGEMLRPEGADISARARSRAASVVDTPSQMSVPDTGIGPTDGEGTVADEDATGGLIGSEIADEPASGKLQALPAPEVNASALSIVIPAAGQAVRYEQLLIEANQTQTITIDARRRLRLR